MQPQLGVEVNERLRRLVVRLQTLLQGLWVVVGAADQGLTGLVVDAGDLGLKTLLLLLEKRLARRLCTWDNLETSWK